MPVHADLTGKQRGMALLVSIVLIFIMSILGVSAMRSATLEGRMVSNAYQKELTLQAAESASDQVTANDVLIESAICAPNEIRSQKQELNAGGKLTTEGTLSYGGRTLVLNYSADFGMVKFITGGEATINGTNVKSRVTQGITLMGPPEIGGGC